MLIILKIMRFNFSRRLIIETSYSYYCKIHESNLHKRGFMNNFIYFCMLYTALSLVSVKSQILITNEIITI